MLNTLDQGVGQIHIEQVRLVIPVNANGSILVSPEGGVIHQVVPAFRMCKRGLFAMDYQRDREK